MKKLLAIFVAVMLLLTVLPMGMLSVSAAAPTVYTDIASGETKTAYITSGGQYVYYRIIPTLSATYTFSSSGSYDTYGYLLNSSGSQLTSNDDGGTNNNFSFSYSLTGGSTYYLAVRMYNSATTGSFSVTVTGGVTLAGDIAAGETKTVSITTAGSSRYYRFVPSTSGSYTFASSGSYDTYGHLLSASGTQLASNDDGGADRNFSFTYSLTAGTTYYLQVRMYSSSTTGSFSVTVTGGGASGNVVQIVPGENTYSLFNSGRTESSGYDADYGSTNPAPETHNNNGYDLYGAISSLSRFRLGQSFTITTNITEQATLNIRAWDVDEDYAACPGRGYEYDYIYLHDETANKSVKLDGHMSGQNDEWNNSIFRISPDLFEMGHTYHFELQMTCTGAHTCGYYCITVRTVSLLMSGQGGGTTGIRDAELSAAIDASGEVSVSLNASAYETGTYTLEYKAVHADSSQQRGGTEYSTSITSTPATYATTFDLESGSVSGTYIITVFIKNASGDVVATREVSVGWESVAVTYDANGGSQNLPLDTTAYASGDTVTVLFDTLPSRANYTFLGWAIDADAVVPDYTVGGTSTFVIGDENVTLYAVWRSAVNTQPGTQAYSLFNSGATSSVGYGYNEGSQGSDYNPDSHSYNNSGYDIYGYSVWGSKLTIGMGLSFRVTEEVIENGVLTIYAYDIDEERDQIDNVYLVNDATGVRTLVGNLVGLDKTWSTTTLSIPVSDFVVGESYHFEVDVDDGGWYTWIRRVSLELTVDQYITDGTISSSDFSATIASDGTVSTQLYLQTNEAMIYNLEYTADIDGTQKGATEFSNFTVDTTGNTHVGEFSLESGSPTGVYTIRVIVKDTWGNTVVTYTCTAGYAYSAVSYNSNGGSQNLPLDTTPYGSGDTVTVLFDTIPSRYGYTFLGWATDAAATTPDYTASGTFTFTIGDEDVTLYAVWQLTGGAADYGDMWDGTASTGFGGGTGTSSDPYLIYTAEQLAYLAQTTNNGTTYSGKYIKLMSNLNLNRLPWTPIGKGVLTDDTYTSTKAFYGNFDGNGHIIYNMSIFSTATSFTGLFGCLYGATITDLGVVDASVTGNGCGDDRCTAGILAGASTSNVVVSRCFVTGAVDIDTGSQSFVDIAGLIGDCYDTTVNDVYVIADINVTHADGGHAGGVMGFPGTTSDNDLSSITDSYFYGTVNLTGSSYTPGALASNGANNQPTTSGFYYNADVSSSVGTSVTVSQLTNQSTFSAFDFVNVWEMGEEYPILRGFAWAAAHAHEYVSEVTTEATCGAVGVKTYTCSICGDTYTDTIPATGNHTYDHWCDADCNVCGYTREVGNHIYDDPCDAICNECGYERVIGDHEYISVVSLAPTCGANGRRTYTCSNCGESYDEWILATGLHTYESGCDADCNVCGYTREAGEHAYVPTVTSAATCGADGVITYTCSNCADTYTGIIAATGAHVYSHGCDAECDTCGYIREPGDHTYIVIITAIPTCIADGQLTYTCSNCGDSYTESVPATGEHAYGHPCDAVCNVCGDTRAVGDHTYTTTITVEATCGSEGTCTHLCIYCGYSFPVVIPATGAHVYDNACDSDCNVCGGNRVPGDHAYVARVTTDVTCATEGVNTYTCSHCGDSYTESVPATGLHIYTNGCDATCDNCGYAREVGDHVYVATVTTAATCGAEGEATYTCSNCGDSYTATLPASGVHTYSNSCDTECDGCGQSRPVDDHLYDHDYDSTCNMCGAIREVPEMPTSAPTFVADSAVVRPGQLFTIAIRTKNNSGIVSLRLEAAYDTSLLELVSIVEKDFKDLSVSPLENNPFIINWVDAVNPDNSTNGVVALVTFRVKADAALGETSIGLSYNPEDVYDSDFDNVLFRVENGIIEIAEYTPGDANNDGVVNNKDLGLLQQLINEWDVPYNRYAADVDNDGRVNNKDLGLIQRYLSGWGVQLG